MRDLPAEAAVGRPADAADAAVPSGRLSVVNGVAFLPIGFAMDGFETMSTLDILAAEKALDNEMEFARAVVANDDALFIEAIDAVVRELL